ncbi:MAG: ABC-type amino acid transport substrate-binding protein [Psychromonas sp.]|jgi:ABC-type amino acid transport substrate-binding protein|uniref:transporter substrate-binding domain-containing protein n=1 Tax=Psychromonas sp. TaxID=1884585 RepID=UPI0039E42AED
MGLNIKMRSLLQVVLLSCLSLFADRVVAGDLHEVKAAGVLRHIGVPYANFITISPVNGKLNEAGFDVDIIRGFAAYLGVEYQFVQGESDNVYGLLTGQNAKYIDHKIVFGKRQKIKGDLVAGGATILDWRKNIVDFSDDYFPAGIWLFARSDSTMQPIIPSGSIIDDIKKVKEQLNGREVLGKQYSSLDPALYDLKSAGAHVLHTRADQKLHEMVLLIIQNNAETTLVDVVDGLSALQAWSGEIKAIGPISEAQRMAAVFPKSSPHLRQAFNTYLKKIRADGTFNKIVKKHYPEIFNFYPDYFEQKQTAQKHAS